MLRTCKNYRQSYVDRPLGSIWLLTSLSYKPENLSAARSLRRAIASAFLCLASSHITNRTEQSEHSFLRGSGSNVCFPCFRAITLAQRVTQEVKRRKEKGRCNG